MGIDETADAMIQADLITDMMVRGWENFLVRPSGSLSLRFILQPTIASFFALRAGINDARAGRAAYLWAAITNPQHRWQLLHGGWKDIRTLFLVAASLDAIYQLIIQKSIYPLELLFTATLLALVPYFILRGPVNRVARRFISRNSERIQQIATLGDSPNDRDGNTATHEGRDQHMSGKSKQDDWTKPTYRAGPNLP